LLLVNCYWSFVARNLQLVTRNSCISHTTARRTLKARTLCQSMIKSIAGRVSGRCTNILCFVF